MNATTLEKVVVEVKKSSNYKKVMSIIKSHRLISKREEAIGFDYIEEKAMGSGGVGQLKVINGLVYVQIGCGHGKWNYASAAKIGHAHTSGMRTIFIESNLSL